jgi:hypothetical protein
VAPGGERDRFDGTTRLIMSAKRTCPSVPYLFSESVAAVKTESVATHVESKGPYPDPKEMFEIVYDPAQPSSVTCNAKSLFKTPIGQCMIYADITPPGGSGPAKMEFTFKLEAETPDGDKQLGKIGDFFQFNKSPLGKEFFEKAKADKTNKIGKNMDKKGLTTDQRIELAMKDVQSEGRTSFTKKIVEIDADSGKRVFSLKTNLAAKEDAGGWSPSEEDLPDIPKSFHEFFEQGGRLKSSPFKFFGEPIEWTRILTLFSVSKNGFLYLKARGLRFNVSGGCHRWSGETASKTNYNRILTPVFGASTVDLFAVEERSGGAEESEAPDEDMLLAFQMAGVPE